MNASNPAFRFRSAVAGLAVTALLTACSDYRGDANALPRNEPLTAALRGHSHDTAYALPKEVKSLSCYFEGIAMVCDVVLDVRDSYVASALKNPYEQRTSLENKTWIRRDGVLQTIWSKYDVLPLRDAKFNFVVERGTGADGWVVRANADPSRVPFEEAAALMLLAVVETTSGFTSTLKELYANSPRANLQSWSDVASGGAGKKAGSMSDKASEAGAEAAAAASDAAADSSPEVASSVGVSNNEQSAAPVSNRPGAAK
ncbi:hypothetical protein [Burkholderia vietnamiensis]|uniref:hypothetical protein n=1 Tax=Burkholderia vietnamiensis TaxID=60552 RepID=UPI001B98AB20|nr:hypothetical protein [Burkholderia vietnamiensis]MBR8034653.1 hypothetical protein [Burkholderia vietnamiensis]